MKTALRGDGIKLSPWTAVPGAPYCAMRFIEGTDSDDIKNRVAFIEKTPRIRAAAMTDPDTDFRNWHSGYKGDDGWDEESQGWCDQVLLQLGYIVPDPKSFNLSLVY